MVSLVLFWFSHVGLLGGKNVNIEPHSGVPLLEVELEEEEDSFVPNFAVEPPERTYSFLEGTELMGVNRSEEYVVGVMIDNALTARPAQSGLEQASIVVEALAEGGVTRFLALFSSKIPFEKVGPVRSARPYFLDIVKPFHGVYVHAGGSDAVLAELRTQNEIFDLDHAVWGNATFWRDVNIARPHNLFTNFANLQKSLIESDDMQGFEYLDDDAFSFSDIALSGERVSQVGINFSYSGYSSTWDWDVENEKFRRSQYISESDVAVDNLVIMESQMWLIPNDPKNRMGMKNTGSGDVMVFQNGEYVRALWQKDTRSSPLQLVDDNGLPITLLRGKTWISIVDDMSKVSVQQPSA